MDGNTDVKDRTLRMERYFDAPPALLFKLWTQPEHMVRWWGCPMMVTCVAETDPREGGTFCVEMDLEDGSKHIIVGKYQEYAPPDRLTMSWAWELEDGSLGHETLVKVSFEESGDGTLLTLHQALFESRDMRDGHNEGWSSSFDRLVAYIPSVDADTA